MKVFGKRVAALIIDISLLVICIVAFKCFLDFYNVPNNNGQFLLIFAYMAKDLLFKNASIGKRIMNIAIYNDFWRSPKPLLLVKRRFFMILDGTTTLLRIIHKKESLIKLFDWERERFGTRVIDLKVHKKLEAKAKSEDGYYSDNMTRLYNEYLSELY